MKNTAVRKATIVGAILVGLLVFVTPASAAGLAGNSYGLVITYPNYGAENFYDYVYISAHPCCGLTGVYVNSVSYESDGNTNSISLPVPYIGLGAEGHMTYAYFTVTLNGQQIYGPYTLVPPGSDIQGHVGQSGTVTMNKGFSSGVTATTHLHVEGYACVTASFIIVICIHSWHFTYDYYATATLWQTRY